MYDVIVPLFNRSITPDTRNEYLRQFKDAKINRILLSIFGYGTEPASDQVTVEALRENIEFFKRNGIDAGVWIGYTIGHGALLAMGADNVPDLSGYTKMVDVAGRERDFVCCPFDNKFRKRMAQYVSAVATSGTSLVLLDDDFRMSQHGPDFCCACELHMARIRELCGENIGREELRELVFSKKSNKYRLAWMTAQRESLELLALDIREAVDKVAPNTRVGFCTAHSVWGVDGTDPVRLAEIMAGSRTKPFIRLHSAPYWSVATKMQMPPIIELARSFASFCEGCEAEIISEGDTYPRPRYNVPSSILEMFDAAMRIDARHDGILKYMVDYNATPNFETSYLKRHAKNLSIMEELGEIFDGKRELGVNVSFRRDLFTDADLELGVSGLYPYVLAGSMMSLNGISTVYGDGGICNAVFGEEARHIDLEKISKGAIIDGIAAQLLRDRGVDVGIEDDVAFKDTESAFLTDFTKKENAFIDPPQMRYAEMKISPRANIVCKASIEEENKPFAYTYENADGARFLVYCFDSMALPKNTGMYRGYLQQRVLKDGIEWISGKRLPAYIGECPELYVMCKGSDGKMSVALFNFFADSVDEPIIKLDRKYSSIRFVNCNGRLDGDTVTLDSPVYAYTFAAFEVSI